MTLADSLKSTVFSARGVAGTLGFRTHTVEVVIRYSDGNARNELSLETTAITEGSGQPPRVRWLTDEQLTVGGLPQGTCEVGPVTPLFATGGTDIALLRGDNLQPGDKLYLRITGPRHPDGALYRITQLKAEKALRYMLQAQPVEQQLYE